MKKECPSENRACAASRLRDVAAGVLLLGALFIAYFPALSGQLIWDDDAHVTRPALYSLHGLWRIWFEAGATQQYYPLLHSAFWIEHRLWGNAVPGYHITNLLLHAGVAFLLVAVVRRLGLSGAWLAAFIFALHPVCVESVAWISEQKNTLSAFLYLASALFYLRFDEGRRRSYYFLASGLFVLALLTKTVTATLPAALLVIFWWRRGRLEWRRDVRPLSPWFLIGACSGLLTAWIERKLIGAEGAAFDLTALQRCLLAGRVIYFYVAKVLFPSNLMFIYPRWSVDSTRWFWYLFPCAVLVLVAGLCVLARRRRGPLAGFLFFAGTLFPVLGFFNVFPFLYSYVADHFQYLASMGIIVPVACGLATVMKRMTIPGRRLAMAVLGALLATLGAMTWNQSRMYRSEETVYRETLARNPGCWMAHNNLGTLLANIPGRVPEAIAHFRAALAIKPDHAAAHNNLGFALSTDPGSLPEAIGEYEAAIEFRPDYPEAHFNLGNALVNENRVPEAIAQYEAAIRARPDYPDAHYNLGVILAGFSGRLPEAIHHLEIVVSINPGDALAHYKLGMMLAGDPKQSSEAIAHLEAALRIKPDLEPARQTLDHLQSITR